MQFCLRRYFLYLSAAYVSDSISKSLLQLKKKGAVFLMKHCFLLPVNFVICHTALKKGLKKYQTTSRLLHCRTLKKIKTIGYESTPLVL